MFFRSVWESGFDKLTGVGGDSTLIDYILEHWFRVLHGQTSWANPSFFYPYKGLLGWSDGLVLFEVIYAPLRWLGADELLAAQIMLIVSSLIGFVTFVALLRRLFDPPLLINLAGGLVFTFANALWYEAGHYQLLAVWLVPPIALVALEAWTSTSRRRSCLFGAITGALVGLLFFTSFYIAWFCVPLAVIGLVAGLALSPNGFRRSLIADVRRLWPALVATGAAFVISLIPFAAVYLPAEAKVPSDTYQLVISGYGHRLRGAFDLGRGNVFWSSALRHIQMVVVGDQGSAPTPILLTGCVVLAIFACRRSKRRADATSPRAVAAAALAITAVFAWLLPVRYHGYSLWILIWHLPGGSAIRAVYRIGLMASALAVTSLVASVAELWADREPARRSLLRPVLAGVMVLVVLEQLDTQPLTSLDRPRLLAFLASVPKAPAGCHSWYMAYGATEPVPPYEFEVDAMLASQRIGLPTLDGYTGYNPPGWNLDVTGPDLDTNAEQWATSHHLTGVCRLDISDMSWARLPKS